MYMKECQLLLYKFPFFPFSLESASLCHMRRSLWEQVSLRFSETVLSSLSFEKQSVSRFHVGILFPPLRSGSSGAGPTAAQHRRWAFFCPQLRCHLWFPLQRHAAVPPEPWQGGNHSGETQTHTYTHTRKVSVHEPGYGGTLLLLVFNFRLVD